MAPALAVTLEEDTRVQMAYLSGSRSKDSGTPGSDTDIAVLLTSTSGDRTGTGKFHTYLQRRGSPPKALRGHRKDDRLQELAVHDYGSVDTALEHEFLQTRLADFEACMKHIVVWLKSTPPTEGKYRQYDLTSPFASLMPVRRKNNTDRKGREEP